MQMLTHGTVVFLTPMADLPARLIDGAAPLGDFLRQLSRELDAVYERVEVAEGERSLVVSIAPDLTPRVWVTRPGVGEREDETRLATRALAKVRVTDTVRAPILFASTFWVGPAAVEVQSFGTRPQVTLPPELLRCAERLATQMETVPVNDLVAEFWRQQDGPPA